MHFEVPKQLTIFFLSQKIKSLKVKNQITYPFYNISFLMLVVFIFWVKISWFQFLHVVM